ncbi:hypothetical protein HMPREF0554_0852 [Pseudoleptotrichia goodfellowii F0264]|uniref:Uncharacterized protein n=1 Tax=Pseudoleptotrichia goodfellowii F0264 TaxID=596323 RepID=D0GJJ1_9FUSO|nr:hypothetical protein HMPREF0554_0852 [Pseudoleptotrichia goodfellowii F0264]
MGKIISLFLDMIIFFDIYCLFSTLKFYFEKYETERHKNNCLSEDF